MRHQLVTLFRQANEESKEGVMLSVTVMLKSLVYQMMVDEKDPTRNLPPSQHVM